MPIPNRSSTALPRAPTLYGTLVDQLQRPGSFASQLKKMLRVRAEYRINESEQVDVPVVNARGLVVMVHRLPAAKGVQVTVLNFGRTAIRETVVIKAAAAGGDVKDLVEDKTLPRLEAGGRLPLALGPHQEQVLLIK